jgi:SET domain-containing protein
MDGAANHGTVLACMKSRSSRRPFRVGRSKTGLGLFATKLIKRGSFIIEYWGRRINNAEADELETKYMFELNKRWTIDGSPRRNIARYINHACKPNAETDVVKGKILITATRTIYPGDEITYHYGRGYFDTFIKPMGCGCPACVENRREERAHARRLKLRREKRQARAKKLARTRKKS